MVRCQGAMGEIQMEDPVISERHYLLHRKISPEIQLLPEGAFGSYFYRFSQVFYFFRIARLCWLLILLSVQQAVPYDKRRGL
jgi:hypothetical protein